MHLERILVLGRGWGDLGEAVLANEESELLTARFRELLEGWWCRFHAAIG
jgi:hypothetical protein